MTREGGGVYLSLFACPAARNATQTFALSRCWCLDIAVEHENTRSWLDEFYKLNCSFCNLKILVAYQLKEDQSSALEFAIRGFDCMGDANKEQFKSSNYLVLFGKRNCELDGGFGDITKLYQAYYKPANSYEFTQL